MRSCVLVVVAALVPTLFTACSADEVASNLDTVSIFGDQVPSGAPDKDTRAAELGVRFRPTRSGALLGVRFYKAAANTGPHTGSLWDNTGKQLATAEFRDESSSGWQRVFFTNPVFVAANTTYVASYHTTVGRYSVDPGFFRAPTLRGPLKALAHGEDGPNSVYAYNARSTFPTSTWQAANYWVDVMFTEKLQNPNPAPAPSTSTSTSTTVPETTTTAPAPTLPPVTQPKPVPPPAVAPAKPAPGPVPVSGAYPNAANTGVPKGVVLTPSGTLRVTTNGAVIDGKDVTGCIDVAASNVVIKNTRVRFTGGCANEIIRQSSGKGLVVQDSELDGQRHRDCGEAIGYAEYTALRVNMHQCSDGPRISGGNVTIRDSWIHNLSNLPGDHGDGIQCYEGVGRQTIVHNTIEGGTNAAYMSADGCDGPALIDNNLFRGGGYTVRLYANQVTFTNNVVAKGSYQFGAVHRAGTVSVVGWANNRLAANADGSGTASALSQ